MVSEVLVKICGPEFNSQYLCKRQDGWYVSSALGKWSQKDSQTCWTVILAKLVNSRLSERPCIKSKMESDQEDT